MRRLILTFALLTVFLATPVQAQSAPTLPVSDLGIAYQFGEQITFKARLALPSAPGEAFILFRSEGENVTRVSPITIDADGLTSYTYAFEQGLVRPFAMVYFSYRVKLQDGQELTSEEFFFRYEDNRFPWQVMEADNVRIHWYAGDVSFGQSALDAAREGLKRGKELLLLVPVSPIDLYIYASATDLQKALEVGGLSWVGGHASPDLRVGLVTIAPGPEQGLEMDRKIPHELAHILTYDLTRERYNQLPVWLREGIASRAEITTNPDYSRALSAAADNQTLIPLVELCASFPPESGRAFLAYAQADSFTRFIIDQYGQTGVVALIQSYGDGTDCEQGATRAVGRPLSQLEADWRVSALGQNVIWTGLKNMFPYLAILAMILVVPLVNAFAFRRNKNGH